MAVADEFDAHLRTVYNWLNEGRIDGVKVGKQWRNRRSELRRFLNENGDGDGEVIPMTTETVLACSFCGQDQHQVERLIAGPRGVYICGQCVGLCVEILREHEEDGEGED